MAKIESI